MGLMWLHRMTRLTQLLLTAYKEWKEALAAVDVSLAFSKADTGVVKRVFTTAKR